MILGVTPAQIPSPPTNCHHIVITGYIYTHDLIAMDSCRPHGHTEPNADPSLSAISTPLNLQAWRMALSRHPDSQFTSYIISGIENGFRVGFNRDQPLCSATKNCPSANTHPQVITDYIEKEKALGRFLGPFPEGQVLHVHISKFGVIPKGHTPGKWRLITDLSSLKGFSVNDGIDPAFCSLGHGDVLHTGTHVGSSYAGPLVQTTSQLQ